MKSRSVWPQKPQDPIIRARVTTGITGFPRLHFISGVLIGGTIFGSYAEVEVRSWNHFSWAL